MSDDELIERYSLALLTEDLTKLLKSQIPSGVHPKAGLVLDLSILVDHVQTWVVQNINVIRQITWKNHVSELYATSMVLYVAISCTQSITTSLVYE